MSSTPDPTRASFAKTRIAIIGGGAAGFFAAVNTAEKNPNVQITIFEAANKPLGKVFISGGGRCNLTHSCFEPARLIEFYPRGQRELRSLFARFQPEDTVRWFKSRGLALKTEEDGRIFPRSDNSQDVIDLFLSLARQYRITVRTQSRVERLERQGDLFSLWVKGKEEVFDCCVLATGYSSPGWQLAKGLGHNIISPVPSLFPFTVNASVIEGLQGIALSRVAGRLSVPLPETGKVEKVQAEGPMLITHTGLSGPLIYRLSAWGAKALADNRYQASLMLDLLPDESEESLRTQLTHLFTISEPKKKVANIAFPTLPNRLWLALLVESGIHLEEKGEAVTQKAVNRLIEALKRLALPVNGKSPSKEEFVSCGGVTLKEVDFKTMQSRLVPGLYFGGEVLNIDGLTGGFNFQACWSGGWAISEALKSI